ncbi:hypothetical protein, partial [Bartonella jaculi]|uniref:hypothetical protein n=1 Tax=Bartonella jaculi TaxID=686226 RepID=UPI0031EE0A8D
HEMSRHDISQPALLFDLRKILAPYIAYCFTIVIGNTMHETPSPYKPDSVSQKSTSLKKHFFHLLIAYERNPNTKPSHKIVFKGTSKAIERHCEVRGTNYHSTQQSLSQAVFLKIAFKR